MRVYCFFVGSLLGMIVTLMPASLAQADVWSDYAKMYTDDVNQWTGYYTSNATDAQKALAKLNKKAAALRAQQAREQQALSQEQTLVTSLQTTQSALTNETAALEKAPLPTDQQILGVPLRSDEEKALQDTERLEPAVQQHLAQQQSRLQSAQTEIGSTNQQIQASTTSAAQAQAQVTKANQALANMKTPTWQAQAAQDMATGLFTTQQQNGFDSRLLLTDLNSLKNQNKLSQTQVDALKKMWDTQLNGTLMGRYVNQQIKKAMASVCDPQFQSACAAGKVDALNSLLNSRLNAAKAEGPDDDESSSDAVMKPISGSPGSNGSTGTGTSSGTMH